jgi:ribose 5-phosphate isomerase A
MSDLAKMNAAAVAVGYVESGMIVGLGTGSTANHFVRMLGKRVSEGLKIVGLPTSEATRTLATSVGVPLIELDHADRIDLTVDGADEIDPQFRLIKGAGGALLREKIIANASDHMVVIADESKLVDKLGAFLLPVEVVSFGFTITAKKIFDALRAAQCAGLNVTLRTVGKAEKPYITDGGNYILDCACEHIPDPEDLALRLAVIPGVVEHGLFLGLARTVIIGEERGARTLER